MEIDLNKIEAELGIGKDVVVELLKEYLKESEGLLSKLEAAVASGDYAVMVSTAHTLKGSAGNLRVTSIQDAARTVSRGCVRSHLSMFLWAISAISKNL